MVAGSNFRALWAVFNRVPIIAATSVSSCGDGNSSGNTCIDLRRGTDFTVSGGNPGSLCFPDNFAAPGIANSWPGMARWIEPYSGIPESFAAYPTHCKRPFTISDYAPSVV